MRAPEESTIEVVARGLGSGSVGSVAALSHRAASFSAVTKVDMCQGFPAAVVLQHSGGHGSQEWFELSYQMQPAP